MMPQQDGILEADKSPRQTPTLAGTLVLDFLAPDYNPQVSVQPTALC